MAGQNSNKGNPAHVRAGNTARKARRQASWTRGEKTKDARRTAQDKRARDNRDTATAGGRTPWQLVKDAQRARKAARTETA